ASISGRCRLTLYLGNWSFDVSASDRVTYGSTGTATATVTPGAGTVSFSAAGSTGCSVSGTTVSVITAGGSCTLTASVAENNNYLAATSAPFSVTLNKALALVIPTNLIQTYTGNPLQPTVRSEERRVGKSFSAGCSTGCSVSGTTVSVITAGGSCTLTASVAENNN